VGVVGVGQRAEEQVDGDLRAALALRLLQAQVAVLHGQVHGGRYHVDAVALDEGRADDLCDWHAGHVLQNFVDVAFMPGRQVHDDHESHAAVLRHVFEQGQQRLETAR